MFLLINIISIVDLFCLYKAFEYADKNNNIYRDNMTALLFWPLLFFIIAFLVIIKNLLLGIAGVVYLRNRVLLIQDFLYANSDKLVLKIVKVIGYCLITFYFVLFMKAFLNPIYTNYYGLLFFILAIANTIFYTICIIAVVKEIINKARV